MSERLEETAFRMFMEQRGTTFSGDLKDTTLYQGFVAGFYGRAEDRKREVLKQTAESAEYVMAYFVGEIEGRNHRGC